MDMLADRYRHASDETRWLVDRLLKQDEDDRSWTDQIGPAYRQVHVASLLGKSKQAVSADTRLIRLEMRSGIVGYPAFQFDGRRRLPGIGEVVAVLGSSVESQWTIASWLTSPQHALGDGRPVDLLRAGEVRKVSAAARRFAEALAAP